MNHADTRDARHYSLANLDAFWESGHPAALPIVGIPACKLLINPAARTITLVTPFTPPEPDVARWRNIDFRITRAYGGDDAELTISIRDNLHGAYGLVTSIADQLQLDGEPLAAAVAIAIQSHQDLFTGRSALSQDKELGLYGELLVLEYLIGEIGPAAAIATWQGPLHEEHDCVFDDVHLEVKSTASEHRQHVIHGFTQLVPLRGVPLSLLSVQLTRSHPASSRSLTQVIKSVRAMAGGHRPALDRALDATGWRDEDADLYRTSWTKRSQPRAYRIDDRFPALTRERLERVVPNLRAVSDPSYRIDVTHFAHHHLPGPLAGLVKASGGPS